MSHSLASRVSTETGCPDVSQFIKLVLRFKLRQTLYKRNIFIKLDFLLLQSSKMISLNVYASMFICHISKITFTTAYVYRQ